MQSEAKPPRDDRDEHTFPTAPGTDQLPPDTPIRRRFFERRLRAYRKRARDAAIARYNRAHRAVRLRAPDELAARVPEKCSALFHLALGEEKGKAKRVALIAAANRAKRNLERYADRLGDGEREAFERLDPLVRSGTSIREAADRVASESDVDVSAETLRKRYSAARRKLA